MLNVENVLQQNYSGFYQRYPNFVTKATTVFLKKLFHEEEINNFIEKTPVKGIPFIDQLLEEKDVSYTVKSNQLENIPAQGRVVIVANHPLGAMDAFALLKLVAGARSDGKVKIVANQLLMSIDPLKELFIPVNNMDGKVSKESMHAISDTLAKEEAVIFFPAGEVSRAGVTGIRDEKWKSGFVKLARSLDAPILPVFIDAKNSWSFYFFSSIYKNLGTVLLSHEMVKPTHKDIHFKVGELIPATAFSNRSVPLKEYAKLFKKHLYKLSRDKVGVFSTQTCIAHPQQRQLLHAELKLAEDLGFTKDKKKIYLVDYEPSPTIMQEIGRLREFSFRKVGEGTGKKVDLDQYDRHYKHIVLWDEDALEIVGSYRIGITRDILKKESIENLYMNELVHISDKFSTLSTNSAEVGRSFVQPKYWGTKALDYLWQGVGAFLAANPDIHFLYGPVSISGAFPKPAKDALVYFYSRYYSHKDKIFEAFEPYTLALDTEIELDMYFTGQTKAENFTKLKEYLKSFDCNVPTLYKQYTELFEENGVLFTDFGVDEAFGSCIDGYILCEVNTMKAHKKTRYLQANLKMSA